MGMMRAKERGRRHRRGARRTKRETKSETNVSRETFLNAVEVPLRTLGRTRPPCARGTCKKGANARASREGADAMARRGAHLRKAPTGRTRTCGRHHRGDESAPAESSTAEHAGEGASAGGRTHAGGGARDEGALSGHLRGTCVPRGHPRGERTHRGSGHLRGACVRRGHLREGACLGRRVCAGRTCAWGERRCDRRSQSALPQACEIL